MRKYLVYAGFLIIGLLLGFLGGRQTAQPEKTELKREDAVTVEQNGCKTYWVSNSYGYVLEEGNKNAEILFRKNKGDTVEIIDDSQYWYKVKIDENTNEWISNKTVYDKYVSPPPALEIVEINSRITKTNSIWWRYAWKLILRNNSDELQTCNAKIKLLDKDKYIIDVDYEYNICISPGGDKTVTGFILANFPEQVQSHLQVLKYFREGAG